MLGRSMISTRGELGSWRGRWRSSARVGLISSIGKGPLDVLDYMANNTMLHADGIVAAIPARAACRSACR
jgi:hypothetical protein